MVDRIVVIAGAAGEGIQSVGEVLAGALAVCGYSVFSWQEFESRIRGGQSSYTIRISQTPVNSPGWQADILLALNPSAGEHYKKRLKPGGIFIFDGEEEGGGADTLAVRFSQLAKEWFGNRLYANSVAAGAVSALVGLGVDPLTASMRSHFAGKEEALVQNNVEAAHRGHAIGLLFKKHGSFALPCPGGQGYLVSGHEAVALGAAWAGCRFIAAYPMSPSTTIITYLAQFQEELGVFVEQAEDEIAAINMALGAGYAGVRAMTATSGGGFALMTEAVSLAGMIETPVVIVLAQRPGPSTGLPTRTAQGDLLFAVHSGHGEFPKAVLAPFDAADAFAKTVRAFDLADRFQIPVILLTDQFLADSRYTLPDLAFVGDRDGLNLADPTGEESPYKRYRLTEDGISPRLFPGVSDEVVCADSDEHDEWGHITEDLETTVPAFVEKRLKKTEALRKAMLAPEWVGSRETSLVLVGWGSTRNSCVEALDLLKEGGVAAALLHFTELWPLPPLEFSPGVLYCTVEGNATGQLGRLLTGEYGIRVEGCVSRSDGLPLDAAYIAGKALAIARGRGLADG